MKKSTYNKDDLVKKLSQKLLFSNEDMKFMVDNFLETILDILKQPQDIIRIEIRNFGVFNILLTKERTNARNPKTKESVIIPERKKIVFKPSKKIKKILNNL